MIKLRGITKFYSTGYVKTFVLRNITLDFAEASLLRSWGLRCRKVHPPPYPRHVGHPVRGEYFFTISRSTG